MASTKDPVKTQTKKALVNLGVTDKKLNELKKKFKVVPDANTADGYQLIVSNVQELRTLWAAVDKERKVQTAEALEHQRGVNAEAKRVTEILKDIAQPMVEAREKVDQAKAEEERLEREAEESRIQIIEDMIATMRNQVNGLLNASTDVIKARLDMVNALEITEEKYQEFLEPAQVTFNQVKSDLEKALDARIDLDRREAENKEREEKMAAQQKELDDKQAALDKQQREADEKAENERKAAEEEQRLKDEAEAKEKADKEAEAKRKALAPDYEKLDAYLNDVRQVVDNQPKLKDKGLNSDMACFSLDVLKLIKTYKPEEEKVA